MDKLNPCVTKLPFIRIALQHSLLVVCSFFPMPLEVHREPYTPEGVCTIGGPRKAVWLYGEEEQPSKKFKFAKLKHIAKVVTKVKFVHSKKALNKRKTSKLRFFFFFYKMFTDYQLLLSFILLPFCVLEYFNIPSIL